MRKNDIKVADALIKFAKITAETIQIQQNNERKAWGLDEIFVDFDKLTPDELRDIVNHGKLPK